MRRSSELALVLLALATPLGAQDKARLALTMADGAAAFSDTAYTYSHGQFYEYDPLARQVVKSPPLAYSLCAAETAGLWWLAGKMKKSGRWPRRVWWLPQTFAIGAHSYALGKSISRWRS